MMIWMIHPDSSSAHPLPVSLSRNKARVLSGRDPTRISTVDGVRTIEGTDISE